MSTAVENENEIKVRTTMPDSTITPGASSINLIRVIREYGPVELEEIDNEISRIDARLRELKAKRDTINALLDVAG